MNLFEILKQLFTNPSPKWILELDDADINPVIIQRFLSLNRESMPIARRLNRFVYTIPAKMYLSIVWSMLFKNGKKLSKAPFIQYPKKKDAAHKYSFIHEKVQRQFDMSDTDLQVVLPFINNAIENNKVEWFAYYAATNEQWTTNDLDITLMKEFNKRPELQRKDTLSAWF